MWDGWHLQGTGDFIVITNAAEVADINLNGGSYPSSLFAMGNKLYFSAYDGTDAELCVMIPQVTPPQKLPTSTPPAVPVQSTRLPWMKTLLLMHTMGLTGNSAALSASDTATEVAEINPSGSSSPAVLAALDGRLYFRASDGTDTELWQYDPTTDSATKVADINPSGSSFFYELTALEGKLYFDGFDGTDRELWQYDPTVDDEQLTGLAHSTRSAKAEPSFSPAR